MIAGLGGVQVISSPYLTVYQQVRFPKSKKRRIRKKWAKRASNFAHVPDPNFYLFDKTALVGTALVGHPVTIERLKAAIIKI